MTTAARPPVADPDRVTQRARARARAAEIVDSSERPRDFRIPSGANLRSAERQRSHAAVQPRATDEGPNWRRRINLAVVAVEIVALVALFVLPVFRVRDVSITGNHLLTRQAVLDAAAAPSGSIFGVDGAAIRDRLLHVPWIRSATVTTDLPNAVHVSIVEWSPVLRVHRDGHDTLVADSGATVDASAGRPDVVAKIPVMVDERVAATTAPSAALVQVLDVTSSSFPSAYNTAVAAYEWRSDGVVTIWTSAGWSAVLGHMDTSDEVAAIPAQLSALAALQGRIDFVHPNFGYVDLENAEAPAVGGAPGLPAQISAALTPVVPPAAAAPSGAAAHPAVVAPMTAPTAAAASTPTPVPVAPAPTATAAPTPTPYTIYVKPTPPTH